LFLFLFALCFSFRPAYAAKSKAKGIKIESIGLHLYYLPKRELHFFVATSPIFGKGCF
jgi:hypothetical protein